MSLAFSDIGISVAILVGTIITAYLVNRFFKGLIRRSSAEINNDPTNYLFLRHTIIALIYIIGISASIYAVPNFRTLASSLLAGAGIMAVAVGFASQHALSNVISGFFIIIFRPFRVNDRLTIRNFTGIVEDITLRHTVIRDFENRRVLIPNELISDEIIINADLTDDTSVKWIDVRISYDSDLDLAKKIMREEVEEHPLRLDKRTEDAKKAGAPEVPVRVLALEEYFVKIRAWAWAKDASDGFVMSCDLYESIKKRFDKEGIEIPYPHRTLVHKKADNSTEG